MQPVILVLHAEWNIAQEQEVGKGSGRVRVGWPLRGPRGPFRRADVCGALNAFPVFLSCEPVSSPVNGI